jgi:hypothetical protein
VIERGIDDATGEEAPLSSENRIRDPYGVVALITEPTPPELSTNEVGAEKTEAI